MPTLTMLKALCVAAAFALLVACASVDPTRHLRVGASVRADVIASLGQPTRVWPDEGGGSTLEYAEQPFGQRCWMFRLDAQGKLLAFRDGLDAVQRERVQPGMKPEQVSRLLGQERSRVFFRFSEEDVWDWNVAADHVDHFKRFNVHFKNGLVARTSISVVFRERRFPLFD
jgi:hypothetical protein